MEYTKKELEVYRTAKKEIFFYKYVIFAAAVTVLFLVFEPSLRNDFPNIFGLLCGAFFIAAMRAFSFDAAAKITSMVEKTINHNVSNIENSANE